MLGALGGVPGLAHAHELACERVLGDTRVRQVWDYPASLDITAEVFNAHTTAVSVMQSYEDARVDFSFEVPLPLGVGVLVSDTQVGTVDSYEGCLAAAAADGRADHHIDESFTVFWETGQAQCTTRISCCSVYVEGQCGPPPPPTLGGAP